MEKQRKELAEGPVCRNGHLDFLTSLHSTQSMGEKNPQWLCTRSKRTYVPTSLQSPRSPFIAVWILILCSYYWPREFGFRRSAISCATGLQVMPEGIDCGLYPPPHRKDDQINSSNIFCGNHRFPISDFSGICSRLILPEYYSVIALPIFK